MKLNKLIWVVALVAITLPSFAQKKGGKAKTAAPKVETKEKKQAKPFYGTIYYKADISQGVAPVAVATTQPEAEIPQSANKKSEKKPDVLLTEDYIIVHPDGLYSQLCGLITSYFAKEDVITLGCRADGTGPLIKSESLKFEYLSDRYTPLMDIVRMKQTGNEEDLKELVNTMYKPIPSKTRVIAGHKCVLYLCEMLESELWVAEDMTLPFDCAPFWGLNHPVLEFGFSYMIQGTAEGQVRLSAIKVQEDETNRKVVDDFKLSAKDVEITLLRENISRISKKYLH